MSFQELLTLLFDALALSCIAIATLDLSREIIALYKQVFITPVEPPSSDSQPKQLPDPWLLPAAEASAPVQVTQVQQKPLLLLAPAKPVEEVQLGKAYVVRSSTKESIAELLRDLDVDSLKLRDARKLAKVLGIAQKVNGRDQKLAFLRSQIKAKLQQETSRLPEVLAQLRAELIAS